MGSGISLGQVIFWVASVIFLISLAVIVFAVVKKIMKKPISKALKKWIVVAIVTAIVEALIVIILLSALISFFRGDARETYIDIPNTEYQLLIREEQFLFSSHGTVYFVENSWWKRDKKLGETRGGDDGYCPFANGDYEITYEDGVVYVSYDSTFKKDEYSNHDSFELPID